MKDARSALGTWTRSIALLALRASQSAFALGTTILLSHQLGNSELSELLLYLSIMLTTGPILVFGFDYAMISFVADAATRQQGAQHITQISRIHRAIVGSLVLLGLLVSRVTGTDNLVIGGSTFPAALAVGWLALAAIQGLQSATLLALGQPTLSLFLQGSLSSGLVFGGLIIAMLSGLTLDGFLVTMLHLVALTASCLVAGSALRQLLPARRQPRLLSSRRRYGSAILLSSITSAAGLIAGQIPFWLVALLGNAEDIVEYGLAFRMIMPISIAVMASRVMSTPALSRLGKPGAPGALAEARSITSRFFTVSAVLAAVICVGAQPLSGLLFDRPDQVASGTLYLLVVGQLILAYFGHHSPLLRIASHQTSALVIILLGAGLPALLAPAAFSHFGTAGIAGTAVASSLIFGAGAWLHSRRSLGIDIRAFMPSTASPRPAL